MATLLHIKNMVCNRCIKVVKEELEKLGLELGSIELGEVEVKTSISKEMEEKIKQSLEENGFELLDDKKAMLIEQIKKEVISLIHHSQQVELNINISHYLEKKIGKDYNYLSSLFSSKEGITIEKYIILQRIEKAKEYLIYNELTLSEIAWKLGYSSVQHLSSQFHKVTGLTPSAFKKQTDRNRKPLDKIHPEE